jgi:hypothetical protein
MVSYLLPPSFRLFSLSSLIHKDIALKLLNSPGQSHEQVFGEELRKYEPIQGKFRENYQKQEQLLAALAEEHRIFSAARNADTAAQAAREQKEQALTKLADAFKVYLKGKGRGKGKE